MVNATLTTNFYWEVYRTFELVDSSVHRRQCAHTIHHVSADLFSDLDMSSGAWNSMENAEGLQLGSSDKNRFGIRKEAKIAGFKVRLIHSTLWLTRGSHRIFTTLWRAGLDWVPGGSCERMMEVRNQSQRDVASPVHLHR